MELEAKNPEENTLPYEPIKFVYTQTIGSVLQKFKEIIDPYTWTYQDILEPKILTNSSKVEYYLFHIAPIYNWLRKVESTILANYILLGTKGGNPLSASKPTFAVQKGPDYKRFDQKAFQTQIKHYLQQWQIVKLCTCIKVRIITTKTDELMQHTNNKPNKNSQNKKQPETRCTHMIKKQKFTSEYKLNDFTPSNIKLECTTVYCDDCQQYVKVKAEITKYPFAPYFSKFYGKEFILNDNTSSKLTYQLSIVYGQDNTYVKTSGGVWYLLSRQKTSVVSFDKIQLKAGLIFVYQQTLNSNKVLTKALPMQIKQNPENRLQQLSFNQDSESQDNNFKPEKPKQLKPSDLHNSQPSFKPQKIQQAKGDQVLEDMSKNPLPIILNKKTTDRKLFKEYKKTVEGLLPKPKQKDQYEKNYDKGKTKKIHKNRQQFRTADFFKLYTDIKSKNPNQEKEENNIERNERFQQKQKKSQNNGQYREKDEEYNQIFEDRRGERKSRGHFKSKFENKFNKDRHGKGAYSNKGHHKKFDKK